MILSTFYFFFKTKNEKRAGISSTRTYITINKQVSLYWNVALLKSKCKTIHLFCENEAVEAISGFKFLEKKHNLLKTHSSTTNMPLIDMPEWKRVHVYIKSEV